jgi:hypothetical protein
VAVVGGCAGGGVAPGGAGKDEADDVVRVGVQKDLYVGVGDQVVRWGGHLGGIFDSETHASEGP